eukprot:7023258-Prymnesium_polylepis.2
MENARLGFPNANPSKHGKMQVIALLHRCGCLRVWVLAGNVAGRPPGWLGLAVPVAPVAVPGRQVQVRCQRAERGARAASSLVTQRTKHIKAPYADSGLCSRGPWRMR